MFSVTIYSKKKRWLGWGGNNVDCGDNTIDRKDSSVKASGERTEGNVLELKGLRKEFADSDRKTVVAVNNLNLRCEAGELVSLCGPSGCGKTTTLRSVAGLETPTAGDIVLGGKRINSVPANRRNVGMVFQSYALFPHLTVFKNVAYPLEIRKERRDRTAARVDDALLRVGLSELKDRYPNRMSGGQQQRVALARALVVEPGLLLFDEPLSNLDAKLRHRVRTDIREVQKRSGITSLYVTHDQNEAMAISDRIAIMKDGDILQLGEPRDVYYHPTSRFVADFLGKANFVPAVVRGSLDGRTSVELNIGVVLNVSSPPFHCHEGEKVVAVIRPEAVQLGPPNGQIRGKILTVEFQGSTIEYIVEVGETILQVTEISGTRDVVFRNDEIVGNEIREKHISVLQAG